MKHAILAHGYAAVFIVVAVVARISAVLGKDIALTQQIDELRAKLIEDPRAYRPKEVA